jgi:hypothetical protein
MNGMAIGIKFLTQKLENFQCDVCVFSKNIKEEEKKQEKKRRKEKRKREEKRRKVDTNK